MKTDPETRLYRATAVMSVGTALSRLTGLLRVSAMAYALGVTGTRLADTYGLANTTPNIIYELVLGGVATSVFVPVLIDLRRSKNADPSPLVSVSLVALAVLSAFAALAAPLLVKIYTYRIVDPAQRHAVNELATFLLRWFSPQIFFYGLSAIAQAILNARRRFGPPMYVPIVNNLIVIATFIVFGRLFRESGLHLTAGARTLIGAGTTAGVVLQAVLLLPFLRGESLRFRPHVADPGVRRVLRLGGWMFGYVVTNQIGLWLVLALATRVTGGVAAYQIAFIFFQLPHGLFAVSLINALHPDLSEASSARDWTAFRSAFSTGVKGVAYLLLPAVAGYVVLAHALTRVLLAHGVARAADAAAVASILRIFAGGLVFFSAFQLLMRCFTALHDTRTPFVVNVAATAVWAGVNLAAFSHLGVPGLAVGHAVSYAFGSVVLAVVLARRVGGLGLSALAMPLLRMASAAALMGGGIWAITRATHPPDVVTVVVGVGAGAILYLAFSQVMGIPERRILFAAVRGRRAGGPVGSLPVHEDSGQIVVSWLLKLIAIVAVLGLIVFEGGSVIVSRLQASDVADQAAAEAGIAYSTNGGGLNAARARAIEFTNENHADFVDLSVDAQVTTITVVVRKHANTILLKRIGATKKYTTAIARGTAPLRR